MGFADSDGAKFGFVIHGNEMCSLLRVLRQNQVLEWRLIALTSESLRVLENTTHLNLDPPVFPISNIRGHFHSTVAPIALFDTGACHRMLYTTIQQHKTGVIFQVVHGGVLGDISTRIRSASRNEEKHSSR